MFTSLRTPAAAGLRAARANWRAGLLLQGLAALLVAAYYASEPLQNLLDRVGHFNASYSPWFAVIVTMTFGGLVPLLIESLSGKKRYSLPATLFTLLLWGWNGFLVEQLYRLQSALFGDALNVQTILKKVLVDQFLWVPLYVAPLFTLAYLWRDENFQWQGVRAALRRSPLSERLLTFMITNWAIWIPAVSVIYAFPPPLQLLLMNLILIFWSLIMSYFTQQGTPRPAVHA